MENVLDKVIEKIKTHILCSITFFRKLHRLFDNSENRGRDKLVTNDVTIWSIRFACWVSKAAFTYAHAHPHASGTHMHACTHRQIILIVFRR
jgi:hypothetical protein